MQWKIEENGTIYNEHLLFDVSRWIILDYIRLLMVLTFKNYSYVCIFIRTTYYQLKSNLHLYIKYRLNICIYI